MARLPDHGKPYRRVKPGQWPWPRLHRSNAIAVDPDGSLVVLEAGVGLRAVIRVNPVSGDRTVVSGCPRLDGPPSPRTPCATSLVGSGPPFNFPVDIAVEATSTIVAVDAGGGGVAIRVDSVSGNRTVFSEATYVGSGAPLQSPLGVAIEADGDLVVVEDGLGLQAVLRVDPIMGNRTIVSGSGIGSGRPLVNPFTITVEAIGSLTVMEFGEFYPMSAPQVVRVDPVTGNRTDVSGGDIGSGPQFEVPSGIAVEADGHLVVVESFFPVAVFGLLAVVRVDPVTGDRTIVSDANTGQGPLFDNPFNIALGPNGQLLVVDGFEPIIARGLNAVVRVDPMTGDRAIVSGCSERNPPPDPCPGTTVGGGPPLDRPTGIAVAADGSLVVVNSSLSFPDSIVRVDPVTGDRTVISGGSENRGSGPPLLEPLTVAVEADGKLIVVEGFGGLKAVMRVDPVTGDRVVISK
jgi:hypothetical protein